MALYTVNPTAVVSPADVNQFTNILNGTTTGVQITNSARIRAQATGATSGGGGYAGQVAGSSPASGSFVAGDFVHDGTLGTMWVCTTGGSPGTWSALPTLISTVVLGTAVSSVTIPSLPAFNNLRVVWHCRTNSGNTSDNLVLTFNGDTAAHYVWEITSGTNTTVTASSGTGATSILVGTAVGGAGTSGVYSNGALDIVGFSQAASGHSLTVTGHWYACWSNSAATNQVGMTGGLYNPTATVTSLTLTPAAGQLVANSVISVYGWM